MQVPLVRYENGERHVIGVAEVEPDLSQPGVIAVSAEVTDPAMAEMISRGTFSVHHTGNAMEADEVAHIGPLTVKGTIPNDA